MIPEGRLLGPGEGGCNWYGWRCQHTDTDIEGDVSGRGVFLSRDFGESGLNVRSEIEADALIWMLQSTKSQLPLRHPR